MSSDVVRRVGRGGAGNWYSKKDVEEAEKAVELPPPATTPTVHAEPAPYARAGRGGAGNFYEPAAAAAATEEERARVQQKTTISAAATSAHHHHHVLSGRGGAGNWSSTAAARSVQEAAEERRKRAEMEAQIQKDVEAGLAMPARTYHGAPEEKIA